MAALTWLVEETAELVLHVRLALLQVLLLETRQREQPTVNPAPGCQRGGKAGEMLRAEVHGFWGGEQGPRGEDSHIDELGLPPHQQMLLMDELEPVHQHVVLTALWKPDAH